MAICVAVPVGEETGEAVARQARRTGATACGSAQPRPQGRLRAAGHRRRDGAGQGLHQLGCRRRRRDSSSTVASAPVTTCVRRREPRGRLLHRPHPVRPCHHRHVDLHATRSSARCCASCAPHDYEEALRLPTEHEYGNGVAIFTRDGDAARDFVSRVQVGMVGVNVPIPVPIAYHTFGGWKRSGFGDLNQHGPDVDPLLHQDQDGDAAVALGHQGRRRVRHPDDALGPDLAHAFARRRRARDRRDGGATSPPSASRRTPLDWDATKHFPVDVLRAGGRTRAWRRSTAPRMSAVAGLRRLDAVRIFEQLAAARPDDRRVHLDPQHVCVDDRHLRHRRAAHGAGCRGWPRWRRSPATA